MRVLDSVVVVCSFPVVQLQQSAFLIIERSGARGGQ
jgi:hypothetical protein